MDEPRRLVGTENGVRIDAQIFGEQLSPGKAVAISYDVTNERTGAVAIADLVPVSSYDPETQTVTVTFGSEIPGHEFLPRLLVIPSGQKKSFSGRAVISGALGAESDSPFHRAPHGLQVMLHFLGDPKPFEQLIGIPERVVRDPQLADALLPKWLERTETVITNVLPMRWVPPFNPDEGGMARRRH
jgi:hypothetical protein